MSLMSLRDESLSLKDEVALECLFFRRLATTVYSEAAGSTIKMQSCRVNYVAMSSSSIAG